MPELLARRGNQSRPRLLHRAGGFALSGRGPRWARALCGALTRTTIPIWDALTVESFAGPDLAVTTRRGLWVALNWYAFLTVLSLAAVIPDRAPDPTAR